MDTVAVAVAPATGRKLLRFSLTGEAGGADTIDAMKRTREPSMKARHNPMHASWLETCLPLFQNGPISHLPIGRCNHGFALLEAAPYPGQR